MTQEKLTQLLTAGQITQEEHNTLQQLTQPPAPPREAEQPSAGTHTEQPAGASQHRLEEENTRLLSQLDLLKKEKLTAAERQKLEMQEKERVLLEKEADLKNRENREYALKAVRKAELDEAEDKDLVILDFVLGDNPTAIDARVKAFQQYLAARDKRITDQLYSGAGRNPQSGTGSGVTSNPYSTATWNFTAQNELELQSPQEAARLKALAIK